MEKLGIAITREKREIVRFDGIRNASEKLDLSILEILRNLLSYGSGPDEDGFCWKVITIGEEEG